MVMMAVTKNKKYPGKPGIFYFIHSKLRYNNFVFLYKLRIFSNIEYSKLNG